VGNLGYITDKSGFEGEAYTFYGVIPAELQRRGS